MDAERALLADFEAGRIDPADFHHRDHLRLAWAMLGEVALPEALARFPAGLRRLAARAGRPGLYHETITWAYLLLIHERRAAGDERARRDWSAFAAAHPDLFAWKPGILERYYTPEALASEAARRSFVMPDRALVEAPLAGAAQVAR
jgi:hypothetical protein